MTLPSSTRSRASRTRTDRRRISCRRHGAPTGSRAWDPGSATLGSESRNCPPMWPSLIPGGVPQAGANNWGPGFPSRRLPRYSHECLTAHPPSGSRRPGSTGVPTPQRGYLLQQMNACLEEHPRTAGWRRIASYELAARMQRVPEILDLRRTAASAPRLSGRFSFLKAAFARNPHPRPAPRGAWRPGWYSCSTAPTPAVGS